MAALALVAVACGGGGGDGNGGGGDDIAVSVSPAGGATTLEAGGTLVLKANVVNTTSNMDVTWSLTGPNCPNNCGTITRTSVDFAQYAAPATVAAQFNVMVTATSIENPAKSGSAQLTVNPKTCPANSSLLSGPYAFQLQGFDRTTGNGFAAIGTITADACGSITAGTADSGPANPVAAEPVTGSYTIGADHRGSLSLTVSGVTKDFAIALGRISNGVSRRAGLIETVPAGPTNTMLVGTLWAQDTSAFAQGRLAGKFAYLLNGWTQARWAAAGTVTRDASGNYSDGLQDRATLNFTPKTDVAWTASTTASSASTGRAELSSGAFDALGKAVLYVVSADQQLVLITDDATGAVLSGEMVAQTGPFTQASLSGRLITNQTQNHMGVSYQYMNYSILAQFTADSVNGTLTSTMNDGDSGCNIYQNQSAQFTYQVAANGQASVFNQGTLAGRYYLTRANAGFLLGLDASVPVGAIRPQSAGPFNVASISGSYFATQAPGTNYYATNSVGVGSSSGNGTLATTMDTNYQGAVVTRTDYIGGALTHTGDGRYTDAYGNVIYAIAPSAFLVTSISPNECYPVVHLFEQ